MPFRKKRPKIKDKHEIITLAVIWPNLTKVERNYLIQKSDSFCDNPGMLVFVDINSVARHLDLFMFNRRNHKVALGILAKLAPYRKFRQRLLCVNLDSSKLLKAYSPRQMKIGIPIPGAAKIEAGNNFKVLVRPTCTLRYCYGYWEARVVEAYYHHLKAYLLENFGVRS